MLFKTLLVSSIVLVACVQQIRGQCATVNELDDCTYKSAFLINRNLNLPTNLDEFKAYCTNAKDSINCLSDFNTNCLTGPPNKLLTKLFGVIKRNVDDRCSDDSKGQEFIDALKCIDTPDKVEQIRKCSDKHILVLEKGTSIPNTNIPGTLCCAYNSYKQCIINGYKSACGDNSDSIEFFRQLLSEYTEELATVTCTQFDNMDKCAQNLPADVWGTMKPLVEAPMSGDFTHNYKTSIPILYRLVEKYIKKSRK